jgi:hypothetical protein
VELRQRYQQQIEAIDADQAAVFAFAAGADGFFRDVAKRSHVHPARTKAPALTCENGGEIVSETITIGSVMICVILGSAIGRAGAVHGLDH